MWQDIKAWFSAQGGFAHVVAAVWSGAILAYAAVPPFHQLVIDIWAKTPPGAREVGLAVVGLAAWYSSTRKLDPPSQPAIKN